MGLFFGMPKLVENSEPPSGDILGKEGRLTTHSGPRDARRVGGAPEGEPDEFHHGRRVGTERQPHEQLRYGGFLGGLRVQDGGGQWEGKGRGQEEEVVVLCL